MTYSRLRQRPSRQLSSFTLIELLVVIAIIAILAAVLTTAASFALKAAARAKAFNTANQIQSAVLNYYTEYSLYPAPPSATPKDYLITDTAAGTDNLGTSDPTAWGTLICILSGNVEPYAPGTVFNTAGATITNSRGIAFLSLKSSDVDVNNAPKNPLPTGPTTALEIYFNIAMDSDYDGILGVNPSAVTTMPNFGTPFSATGGGSSTAGCAVWGNCYGGTAPTPPSAGYYVHTY